jgi:Arc/MetJ-type ribon-helix-helix transcriptional regulator
MKSYLVPISCSIALALMAGAAATHWFAVREMVALAAVIPPELAPATKSLQQPSPAAAAKDVPLAKGNTLGAVESGDIASTSTPSDDVDIKDGLRKLLEKEKRTAEENKELRELLAETNRDISELRFQVDSHSSQFRPLKVEEEPEPFYNDGFDGVLPPISAP